MSQFVQPCPEDSVLNPFRTYFWWAKDQHMGGNRFQLGLRFQERLLIEMERYCYARWEVEYRKIPWWRFSDRRWFRANMERWVDSDYDMLWDNASKILKEEV